jgi:hypothetical protein
MTPRERTDGLLVTGLPRSGTSWVGKMLEASGEVVYVNEPLNPQHPPGHSPGVLDAQVTHRFQYISAEDDEVWRRAYAKTLDLRYGFRAELKQNRSAYDLARMAKYGTSFTLGRWRGRRAMLDDPFATFSTGWLVEEMGCTAVVLVRDPVSWVGSWRALNWRIHFHELLEQPRLVHDHLEPYVERMRALVGSEDWLARMCLLWEATYDVVDRVFRPMPGVNLIAYESLVQDPLDRFADLYGRLGLTWSDDSAARVREATTERSGSAKKFGWSFRGGISRTAYQPQGATAALSAYRTRLSPDEVERVRELTADVASRVLPTSVSAASSAAG